MSLRDYFAAQALQGMSHEFLSAWCSPGARHWLFNECRERDKDIEFIVTSAAYKLADAMLETRKETPDDK